MKEELWTLIATGIALRDKGLKLRDTVAWREECLAWEAATVAAAKALSPDLAHLISPLGDLDGASSYDLVPHQRDVMAMSTIIRILRERLPDLHE